MWDIRMFGRVTMGKKNKKDKKRNKRKDESGPRL
jgi:hypothetical protein